MPFAAVHKNKGLILLHIILVNYAYPEHLTTAASLFKHAVELTHWAETVQAAGAKVTVLQRFGHREDLQQAKVVYHLVADGLGPRLRPWHAPRQLHWTLRMLGKASVQAGFPTLVQINSLHYPLQTWQARTLLPKACALVVQHQGEAPWAVPRHLIQRWGMRLVDGFLFASRAAAQPWLEQRIIPDERLVYKTPDGSATDRQGVGKKFVQIYEEILQRRTI